MEFSQGEGSVDALRVSLVREHCWVLLQMTRLSQEDAKLMNETGIIPWGTSETTGPICYVCESTFEDAEVSCPGSDTD
jgi:hypothetical protein